MSKKPASLTSDLLARKGEAEPSSADPASRVTLTGGRQPDFSGIGRSEGPSQGLYARPVTERPEMHGMDEEERPRPPEPEIIYTPEDYDTGSRTRLIAGAFIGLALLGGVIVAMSLNDGGDVAPLSSEIIAPPAATPSEPAPSETMQAAAPAPTPEPEPEVAAAPEEAAPATEAEAAAPEAATPEIETAEAEAAPEALVPEPAPAPATPAPAATATAPATGGAFVVQLAAVREEAAAGPAYKALQDKHSAILGGHALDVERADLGDKGIFYRVRAAGFDSKAAATTACGELKAAGQDCLVRAR